MTQTAQLTFTYVKGGIKKTYKTRYSNRILFSSLTLLPPSMLGLPRVSYLSNAEASANLLTHYSLNLATICVSEVG